MKWTKKLIFAVLLGMLCVFLMACGSEKKEQESAESSQAVKETAVTESDASAEEKPDASEEETKAETDSETDSETETSNTLVVYFSATGHTKAVAEKIADGLKADLYEIVPEEPYTDADLDYNDDNSRCTLEMKDSSARPGISGTAEDFEQYSKIYLGYPIWWGEAPRILDTFVESYDFTGKTVIPFCTSASSGIEASVDTLKALAGSGDWVSGKRFGGSEDTDEVTAWAEQY